MSPLTIGWLGIVLFLILLAAGVPIGIGMAFAGFLGYWLISGSEPLLAFQNMIPYSSVAVYSNTVIPLFIIMGHFASYAGFAADLFETAKRWFGRLPGGVVQTTIAGAAAFGAACGSGMASCAILAKITIPEMLKQGVQRELSFGVVAASGSIAAMIPPSIMMVIYGSITGTPIGKLLIAGIIPGIVAAAVFMIWTYVRVRLNPQLAPMTRTSYSWRERFISLRGAWGILIMVLIVLGGIYTGVFTPTEAGATGAAWVLLIALALRRLSLRSLRDSLLDTAKTTGSIFVIIIGGAVFSVFMAVSGMPRELTEFLTSVNVPPIVIIVGIMVIYIILGTVIDTFATLLLTIPIFFPVIVALGYDPIWFGVLAVHVLAIGVITPPYGIHLFILKGVVPGAKISEVMRGVMPFVLAELVILAIYIAFPQISLFLPRLMT